MWSLEIAILWVVCGIAASFVASGRGANGCLWFGLGILLGPIGLAISFGAGSAQKNCPYCRSRIHEQATRCPKCQADLVQTDASAVCEKCGAEVPAGDSFCGVCGSPTTPHENADSSSKQCASCGAEIPAGLNFCGACGARTSGPVPVDPGSLTAPIPSLTASAGTQPGVPWVPLVAVLALALAIFFAQRC